MEFEYKDLIIKKFTEETLEEMLQLNEIIINSLENKMLYSSPTKEICLDILKDETNLFVGIYNKLTKKLMAYATLQQKLYPNLIKLVTSYYKNVKQEDFAYFKNIAVHPDFRGQKIQQKVEEFFVYYLKEKGKKYLTAYTHPDNFYSKNNFLKSGYQIISTTTFNDGTQRLVLVKKIY